MGAGQKMRMRTTWYPRDHLIKKTWYHSAENANQEDTIIPIIHNDDAIDPQTVYTHPENSSFAVYQSSNCAPDSKVNFIKGYLELSLTKPAIETDAVKALRVGVQVITSSFPEDLDVADEVSGTDIKTILGLQKETTDRQVYPLYDGNKLNEVFTNSALLHADQPGLTTTQVIENVGFTPGTFYSCLDYYTNGDLMKKMQRGLKWYTLTERYPFIKIPIKIDSRTKRINPYTFLGLRVYVPQVGSYYQIPAAGDTTAINHVRAHFQCRYDEWNEYFKFMK